MRKLTYKIVLLTLIFCSSCTLSTQDDSPPSAAKSQAESKFKDAVKSTNARLNWQAIAESDEAIKMYKPLGKSESWNRYLLQRNKAKLLNRERLYHLASSAMDTALTELNIYKRRSNLPEKFDYELELLSTKRYKATYLRKAHEFQESTDILFELLGQAEPRDGVHAILKNLIGLNFYALDDFQESYRYFDDLLKISDLEPKMRAHYLHNRANAGYRIDKKIQAFADLSEAIGINAGLNRPYYVYQMRKDLGDLYLREGNAELAMNNFDLALSVFSTIDADPNLFDIYNLKWSAALVLGQADAYLYKDKFDNLTKIYSAKFQVYDRAQEIFIIKSKSDAFNIKQQKDRYVQQLVLVVLGALVAFLALFLVIRLVLANVKARIVNV